MARKKMHKPKMPSETKGVAGLATVIKFAIELKMYNEASGLTQEHKPEKLTGIALQI
jgi:hypothetical protein